MAGVTLPVPQPCRVSQSVTVHQKYACRNARPVLAILWLFLVALLASAPVPARADQSAFTNFLQQGETAGRQGDIPGAIKFFKSADQAEPDNSADLCIVTRHYCDLMYATTVPDLQKQLAGAALDCAQRAVQADPKNPTAHLCVGVAYAKNFPYVDNRTEVKWSRAIKTEAETAIALDPKQDLGYYLLGRWNYDTANLNFLLKGLVKLIYGGLPQSSNEEAIRNFKKAIALAPNRILHRLALARAYETTGQPKLALIELKKCRTLKPVDLDDAAAQKAAAALLAKIGP